MACDCNAQFGANTGVPSCSDVIGISVRLVIAPMTLSNGNKFSIAAGQVIDQTFWDSLINAENPQDRLYPIPGNLENYTDERGDPVTESFNSGRQSFIRDGLRLVDTFSIGKIPPKIIGKLKDFKCGTFGLYAISAEGSLIGDASSDQTELYPIEVAPDTWNPEYIKITDTTIAKIRLRFQWSPLVLDENLNQFPASSITANLLQTSGLNGVDVEEVVAPTLTTFTVNMTYQYGNLFSGKKAFTGVEMSDIVLQNVTQSTEVTIDTWTESTTVDGQYVAVYSSGVSSSDVLQIVSGATTGVLNTIGYEVVPTPLTAIA